MSAELDRLKEEILKRLQKPTTRDTMQSALDDLIIELKELEACDINNAGGEAQLEFIESYFSNDKQTIAELDRLCSIIQNEV